MIRRRDPMELMLLGLCLLAGLSSLLGNDPPSSVEQTMPGWLVVVWNAALTVSGAVGVVGNMWPGALGTGLLVRAAGLLVAFGPAGAYAVAALSFAGLAALFPAGLVAAFAGACLWKAQHLTQDLRTLREVR
jgi:hypothetical protein